MAVLKFIHRYPVKSFPAEQLDSICLSANEGLPDDRRYAITNGIAETGNGAWISCRSFFINAVNDGLLTFANESSEDTITLRSPDGTRLSWRKGDPQSLAIANRKLADFIAPLNPDPDMPPPVITERTQLPGLLSGYWDFDDSAVSLMNLASFEAVAGAMGKPLDPRRLRGNLYLGDLPAWEEFALLGRRIRIGKPGKGAELEILRPAKRCPATSVNPQTGERDLSVPPVLAEHFGHGYCGMYAKIAKSGTISEDDPVTVLGEAQTPFALAANPADTDPRQWPKPVEVISAELLPAGSDGSYGRRLTLRSASPWPLPEAMPGQRLRFHLATGLIGVATVSEHCDHTTVLHVEPSQVSDPATAHLIEKVKTGDRLIVSGPFGRG